ncbi:MAG TPA: hypothetical protein VJV79_38915 [Polyangiaceae bacterium]|nr:hypothetical protein [Polyangiaceae bacterium]
MIGSVRVVLKPISRSASADFRFVSGASVALERRGPGRSKATPAPQPASLVFSLGLLKSIRVPVREDQPLATLNGQLELQGPTLSPKFTIEDEAAVQDDRPPPPPDSSDPNQAPPRLGQILLLEFEASNFRAPELIKLKLPPIPADVRHLELQVELRVAGAVESSAKVNDVLDKPMVSTRVRIVPPLCLDTTVPEPEDHNLVLLANLPNEQLDVESLRVGGDELTEGEHFFQDGKAVYFRPKSKPTDKQKGQLISKDGREFDFELRVARNVNEQLDSLGFQLANAINLADAAAQFALQNGKPQKEAELLRVELLAQARLKKRLLLDSIESALSGTRDFGLFYGRVQDLPGVSGETPVG